MENTSISRVLSLFMTASLSIAGVLFVPIKRFKTNNIKSKIQLGSTTPNDTYFSDNQWAYSSTSLENAWDISLGNNDVTVAVIDTGVKTTHHDLVDNINQSFLMSSYDLANNTISSNDYNGHGTNVAGIIGAKGNNSLGVAGVCWSVDVIPLTYFDVNLNSSDALIAAAIDFAEQNNIPIINFSSYYTGSIDSSIENAIRNYSGLFICCSGNSGQNIDTNPNASSYPTQLSNVDNLISAGSLNSNGEIRPNSNYGAVSVDLFAPGDTIKTTKNIQDEYEFFYDTSCAAPFVAGAAALLKAINPSLTPLQIKNAILNNVDTSSEFQGKCVSGGKLNIYNAALSVIPTLSTTSTRNVDGGCYNWEKIVINSPSEYSFSVSGNAGLTLELASSPMNNIVPLETATIASGQTSASFNHLFTQAGTYYVKVTNGLLFDINYTLTSTFVAYHYHSFNGGPVVPIDAVYHGSQCICGEIGNIMQHTVKPKNPNYCIICGGAALLPNNLQPVTNQFVKPVGLDSFTNEDGVVLIGDLDLNILLLDSSYDAYLHNF